MQDQAVRRVLIVGGGIAGLGLATGLASHGVTVQVAELNGYVHGSGVGYWAFGVRAFDALGLRDKVEARSYTVRFARLHDRKGQPFADVSAPLIAGTDYPNEIIISRRTLARTMLEAARGAGARIDLGVTVESYEDRGACAHVRLTDGQEGDFDLVVAADGVFSAMRQRYFDASIAPEFVPAGAWRSLIPFSDIIDVPSVFDGGDMQVYIYPCGGGEIYAGIATAFAEPRYPDGLARARFVELLERFNAPKVDYVRTTIAEGTMQADFRPFNFHFIDGDWYKGRLLLIGDAAHSMAPSLSCGAGMAIEDAAVLTDEISRGLGLAPTLESFMRRRRPRAQRAYRDTRALLARATDIGRWSPEEDTHSDALDFLADAP